MNITVKIFGRDCYICRPDTTWERENRDFYSPEFINSLWYTPVVFARISKAGKYIAEKFAARYYDGMNFGILLYPGGMLGESGNAGLARASVLDHTSVLPFPLYLPEVMSASGNEFFLKKGSSIIFSADTGNEDMIRLTESSISGASKYVSQRIGDLVAIELAAPEEILGDNEKRAEISAHFCGNELFRLSLIK